MEATSARSHSGPDDSDATTDHRRSTAVDDYIKAIWLIIESGDQPTGQAIALRLGVSQASVTSMLRRLDELGLVNWQRYRTVELTPAGHTLALEVIRHHRLIECFLADVLDMPWDEVHAEAEILEHHISERLEERISARLGHPQYDPHGHPIPARDGTMPHHRWHALASVGQDEHVVIRQVRDDRPEVLRHLTGLGMTLGATVTVTRSEPVAGVITIAVADGATHTIGTELAARIDVS